MPAKAPHEETGELKARLKGLADSLGGLRFVPGTAAERSWAEPLERASRLARSKLLPELERGFAKPLVAVVAGGTNVGKSSLFNALVGEAVSSVDPRAGHTVIPVAAGGRGAREILAALLPEYTIAEAGPGPEGAGAGGARGGGKGEPLLTLREVGDSGVGGAVLVIDSPDVDSSLRVHHERAEDTLLASDVLVFVTSPTKYNDKRCVEFLLRASDMGKPVAVLFNLLPGGRGRREILGDFRRSVLARLPKEARGKQAPPVFEFDASVAQGAGEAGVAGKLVGGKPVDKKPVDKELDKAARDARAFLKGEGDRASHVKRLVASGGARYLARSLRPALTALREQAKSLEVVRATLERTAGNAADSYARFLRGQGFIELEVVLKRLVARFRVPVLDDALDVLAFVPRKLVGAILRRPSVEERHRAEERAARAKEVELVTRARVEFARSLEERGPDEVAGLVYREIVTPEYFAADLEAAWTSGAASRAAVLEAWIGGFEGELASKIERSPGVRKTLKTVKALLELGVGVAAILVGGLGVGDLVLGPAVTAAVQQFVEWLSPEYFRRKREEYVALARSTFTDGLEEVLMARLRERIPSSPVTGDVDALDRELNWLARSFPATVARTKGGGG